MDRQLLPKGSPIVGRVPATPGDGERVIPFLRYEDKREVEALGFSVNQIQEWLDMSDHAMSFHTPTGKPAGVAGVVPTETPGVGSVWMLCTVFAKDMPFTIVRGGHQWLAEVAADYKMLSNIADKRNTFHHKLLDHLGFKLIREVEAGPNKLPFYEIVKLCVPPPQ
jgi:hypothetical protein